MDKILLIVLFIIGTSNGWVSDSVNQYGVTFYFSSTCTCGTWANGDYWVKGPVTIDSITPHRKTHVDTGFSNGWEIDPFPADSQCMDWRITKHKTNKYSDWPQTISGTNSILKSIENMPYSQLNPALKTGVVLTVVTSIPPDSGVKIFRPPYVGTTKTYYYTDSIKYSLLPRVANVYAKNLIDSMHKELKYPQIDHTKYGNQRIRPLDAFPNGEFYAANVAERNCNAILSTFLSDAGAFDTAGQRRLIIDILQGGIDYYHMWVLGQTWVPNASGEAPGFMVPIAYTAMMLNSSIMKGSIIDSGRTSAICYEDYTVRWNHDSSEVLWGQITTLSDSAAEVAYWNNFDSCDYGGLKLRFDPLKMIDGGCTPGGEYQYCCTSQPFKSESLIWHMMDTLQSLWNPTLCWIYAERWVEYGTITQPDSCAPRGAWADKGITWGPTPQAGDYGCIKDENPADGIGRMPSADGSPDVGDRKSPLADVMWDAYYNENLWPITASVPNGKCKLRR